MSVQIIIQAKKKLYDYKIIEKLVVGIVLTGNEIKSLRNRQVSIDGAYVVSQQRELYIVNMTISAYKCSQVNGLGKIQEVRRKRKLLLKRREINKLIGTMQAKNYVLIPLQIFINNKGWAKLEIATAQHLRKYRIKEKIKEREILRSIKRKNF